MTPRPIKPAVQAILDEWRERFAPSGAGVAAFARLHGYTHTGMLKLLKRHGAYEPQHPEARMVEWRETAANARAALAAKREKLSA